MERNNNHKSIQSIKSKKGVKGKNFSPRADRIEVIKDIGEIQSIVAEEDVELTGDFSPEAGVIIVSGEERLKKSTQLTEIIIRNTSIPPLPSPPITVSQITVEKGHVLVGNTTGDNTNLSHNTSTYESQIDSESQTTSKSKNIYQTLNREDEVVVKQPEVIIKKKQGNELMAKELEKLNGRLEEEKNSCLNIKNKEKEEVKKQLEEYLKLISSPDDSQKQRKIELEIRLGKKINHAKFNKLKETQKKISQLEAELLKAQIEIPPKSN